MARWLLLLGGLLIWFAHFLGLYAIASVAEVAAEANAPAALWIIGGFTLVCAATDLLIGATALRRWKAADDSLDRFIRHGATWGAGLSFIAVLWQGLPILIGL